MFDRLWADSFSARAFPPFTPPFLLACIAAVSGPLGESFGTSPVDMSTMSLASWFGSRGRLGCLAMGGA